MPTSSPRDQEEGLEGQEPMSEEVCTVECGPAVESADEVAAPDADLPEEESSPETLDEKSKVRVCNLKIESRPDGTLHIEATGDCGDIFGAQHDEGAN